MSQPKPVKQKIRLVRLRPETRPKWDAIAKDKGWKFSELADRLADDLIRREGIAVPTSLSA